jgi:hypothetical protein
MQKIIRTIFGSIEKNDRLRLMFENAQKEEEHFPAEVKKSNPIYYLVLGDKNADWLIKHGIKDVILIDKEPDARPNAKLPIYYNKTFLALKSWEVWGKHTEFVLIDMDTRITKWPDERMPQLLALKPTVAGWQSPVRINYRYDSRVPLLFEDLGFTCVRDMLICSCVIYCKNKEMWSDYLDTYQILYDRLVRKPVLYRNGRTNLIDTYHDEHTLTYYFDMRFGALDLDKIIDMVEPFDITKMDRNHRHKSSTALKTNDDNIFFRHRG